MGRCSKKGIRDPMQSLVGGPILHLPKHSKTFILRVDASNCGLGAALMQEHEDFFQLRTKARS